MSEATEGKPDPTQRTIETLHREISSQRELFDVRLSAVDQSRSVMDRTLENVPVQIEKAVKHLADLMDVELKSVGNQFKERDTRSEREARDNKLAVDAAFAAQEKQAVAQNESNALAINKSEVATNETIKTNRDMSDSQWQGMMKTVDELKLQVNTLMTGGLVIKEQRVDHRAVNTQMIAVASVCATLFGGVLGAGILKMLGG